MTKKKSDSNNYVSHSVIPCIDICQETPIHAHAAFHKKVLFFDWSTIRFCNIIVLINFLYTSPPFSLQVTRSSLLFNWARVWYCFSFINFVIRSNWAEKWEPVCLASFLCFGIQCHEFKSNTEATMAVLARYIGVKVELHSGSLTSRDCGRTCSPTSGERFWEICVKVNELRRVILQLLKICKFKSEPFNFFNILSYAWYTGKGPPSAPSRSQMRPSPLSFLLLMHSWACTKTKPIVLYSVHKEDVLRWRILAIHVLSLDLCL